MPTTNLDFGPAGPPALWLASIKVCRFLILYGLVSRLNGILDLATRSFPSCVTSANGRSQFPNLSCFARDILSIPGEFTNWFLLAIQLPITNVCPFLLVFYAGSAVAVERVFSGSHDTISLRCASLNPETIWTLMLVKQRLRLARTAVHDILGA